MILIKKGYAPGTIVRLYDPVRNQKPEKNGVRFGTNKPDDGMIAGLTRHITPLISGFF